MKREGRGKGGGERKGRVRKGKEGRQGREGMSPRTEAPRGGGLYCAPSPEIFSNLDLQIETTCAFWVLIFHNSVACKP